MSQPLCYRGGFYTRNFVTLYINTQYVTADIKAPGDSIKLIGQRKKGYPLQPIANAPLMLKEYIGFIPPLKQHSSFVWANGVLVTTGITDAQGNYEIDYVVPDTGGNPINLNVFSPDDTLNCYLSSNDDILYVGLPETCSVDADCKEGFICSNGKCIPINIIPPPTCSVNADCGEGYECVDGECVPETVIPTPPSNRLKLAVGGLLAFLAVIASVLYYQRRKKK